MVGKGREVLRGRVIYVELLKTKNEGEEVFKAVTLGLGPRFLQHPNVPKTTETKVDSGLVMA